MYQYHNEDDHIVESNCIHWITKYCKKIQIKTGKILFKDEADFCKCGNKSTKLTTPVCCQLMKDITTSIHRHATIKKMGESRGAYRVLVGRPEGKRPLGRPKYM
jgi:hypothetical protein